MNDDQIKHMVSRFLNWKLPENFNPDGGISFVKYGNIGTEHQYKREPSGTNLIGYAEATEMVRHMIEGMPGPAAAPKEYDWLLSSIIALDALARGGKLSNENVLEITKATLARVPPVPRPHRESPEGHWTDGGKSWEGQSKLPEVAGK